MDNAEGSVRPAICGEELGESENCMGGNGILSKAADELANPDLRLASRMDIDPTLPTNCIATCRALDVLG